MNRSLRRDSAIFLFLASLALHPLGAQGATARQVFAEGRIVCAWSAPKEIPEWALAVMPIAMEAALERIGPPAEPVRLEIRLLAPPPFYKRAKALVQAEAFATQTGDEIALHPGNDPLKLAFRLGHELAHWLVYKRLPARPPLWLDEGLAQMVAAEAAETCARTRKQDLERPRPPKLEAHLFTLDELIDLQAYPRSSARSAAFYWQVEALVRALAGKLGAAEFAVYLGLMSRPNAPAWQAPLRERWYFSDWDVNWLAEQIRPKNEIPNAQ
ncbi:MAG: hypothetical protein AB7V22_04535 [Kiritimatiellia bacterium]